MVEVDKDTQQDFTQSIRDRMGYAGYSTRGLTMMLDGVAAALAEDDATTEGDKPFGVRTYADWRRHADALEAELSKRGADFTPISW
jgi:hypothetical protein